MAMVAVPRGLASAGRRCRASSAPVLLPLVQRGLDASSGSGSSSGGSGSSNQAVGAYPARGFARSAAASVAAPAVAATIPWPYSRPDAGRIRGQAAMTFSTSADAGAAASAAAAEVDATGEGGGGVGAESQGDAGGEATAPLEENPLEGMVADDGDPGPPPPLDPSIVTEPSPKVMEVMAGIDSLNFVEMAMLIDVFKNKLGLEEVPTLSFGGSDGGGGDSGGDGGDAPASSADKTIFKVKVTGFGDKAKIKVIKEVRGITGLGLREAKEMVESLPQVVKEDLKEDEAQELKAALEAAGATVELE